MRIYVLFEEDNIENSSTISMSFCRFLGAHLAHSGQIMNIAGLDIFLCTEFYDFSSFIQVFRSSELPHKIVWSESRFFVILQTRLRLLLVARKRFNHRTFILWGIDFLYSKRQKSLQQSSVFIKQGF